MVGRHSKVQFWEDNWLGFPLIHLISKDQSLNPHLGSLVWDFVGPNISRLLDAFCAHFTSIAYDIRQLVSMTLFCGAYPLLGWFLGQMLIVLCKTMLVLIVGGNLFGAALFLILGLFCFGGFSMGSYLQRRHYLDGVSYQVVVVFVTMG